MMPGEAILYDLYLDGYALAAASCMANGEYLGGS